MKIFPAIDLYDGKAVRLFKGDYSQMTVYSDNPVSISDDFVKCGAQCIHIVDLEGAKSGNIPNFDTVLEIKAKSGLFCEIGGGIRDEETIETYIKAGLDRVILGTAAVENRQFLEAMVDKYGEKIAVSVDVRDNIVQTRGWIEKTNLDVFDFFDYLERIGLKFVICTDISKDGAMSGTNRDLYKSLVQKYNINITASGGVSSIDDVKYLKKMGLYGAIIGKAYYNKSIDLAECLHLAIEQ